jgi:hypothetical protein
VNNSLYQNHKNYQKEVEKRNPPIENVKPNSTHLEKVEQNVPPLENAENPPLEKVEPKPFALLFENLLIDLAPPFIKVDFIFL